MTTTHGVENPVNIDGTRTPEQIQRELGQARSRIDGHLDELDSRFSTGGAVKEAAYEVRDRAAALSSSIGRVVRDNPVPALLIGAGAAWIAVSALGHTRRGEAVRHRVSESAHELAHRAADQAGALRHRAEGLGQRAGEIADSARDQARDLGQRAREGASDIGHKASGAFESQPLLIGALGLAIGAAIGASIPSSRREDELVGPYRDRLRDEAMGYGREQVAHAGEAAHDAIEVARKATGKALDEVTGELGTPRPGGNGAAAPKR